MRFFGILRILAFVLWTMAALAGAAQAGPLNIAHRGARSLAPENTLPAFQIALERCGADMIELDVHLSKDSVPVIIHDDDLTRTTNAEEVYPTRSPWWVGDFTYAELLRLDAGSWFVEKDPFGQIKARQVPDADLKLFSAGRVRLPTLRQALTLVAAKKSRVNIEIKYFPVFYAGIIEKVLEEVRAAHLEKQVLISTFNHEALVEIRKQAPEIQTGALCDQPVFPLDPYLKRLLKVNAYNPGFENIGEKSLEYRHRARLREDVIKAAHEAGLKVNVWTVNRPEDMRALWKAGVDGIITDFPQTLHQLLKLTGKTPDANSHIK